MNRVLIVACERETGERYQQALGQDGFQTAVVWSPIQMVEFCRQHTPDMMILDLDLAEFGLWSAIQAIRGMGTLANIPFVGLAASANRALFEKAEAAGFLGVFPTHEGLREVFEILRRERSREQVPGEEVSHLPFSRDPSLNRLREIARNMIRTAASLRNRLGEYGEDGPELFSYIENSGQEIRARLNRVSDFSLHDRELRHDFRNMIGAVTGFAELILMETGLSGESTEGLTSLRRDSREFVEILDIQKAGATA
jgi:CheY-like chemotaxis protein